jgi:NAD-reducing hydrogenase small subunit
MDYHLPGCPPSAELIWEALYALITGDPLRLPYDVVKFD